MIRILHSRKELTDDDIPLRVFGTPLCGRCRAVKECLAEVDVLTEVIHVNPGNLSNGLTRHEAATLLAVFTAQDELLPAIIGRDWESIIFQQDIEEFCK